jgi:two-component system NtrC family response regulator/two-component system response regulator HydG
VSHFIEKYGKAYGKELRGLAPGTLNALLAHDWPGNVRELENVVERAVVLAKGAELTADDLPPTLRGPRPRERAPGALIPGATLYEIEREAILRTLEMVGGSTSRAAEILGISVRKIQYRLKEYAQGGEGQPGREADDADEAGEAKPGE